ncbi:MAG: hypothetical protein R3310_11255 [Candidatus Competibacteraceae bacterium]|nr:hypothetical protein [Candidatus Competibacteraceae bacterium]
MNAQLSTATLSQENLAFAGSRGVSHNNRGRGFVPAFLDTESGRVQRAKFRDGSPAPMHLLDGLPEAWITDRLPSGRVLAVKGSVVAGFLRAGRFYTREQAALDRLDG